MMTLETGHTPKKSVFCIAASRLQADRIVDHLKNAGFSSNDISALFPDRGGTRDFAHEKNTKAPEGAATGVGAGIVLGGAFGWLVGLGVLAIPGLGQFVAAGPLASALSGAAVGAAVGEIAGSLVGMGIPEYEARRYEGKVKDGNILISVHAEGGDEAVAARKIFTALGAEDIATANEVEPEPGWSKPHRPTPLRRWIMQHRAHRRHESPSTPAL
jgi:hypothetical protein